MLLNASQWLIFNSSPIEPFAMDDMLNNEMWTEEKKASRFQPQRQWQNAIHDVSFWLMVSIMQPSCGPEVFILRDSHYTTLHKITHYIYHYANQAISVWNFRFQKHIKKLDDFESKDLVLMQYAKKHFKVTCSKPSQ